MNNQLLSAIENLLSEKSGKRVTVDHYEEVSGGSINDSYKIRAGNQDLFIKTNAGKKYPGMFSSEAKGLQLLESKSKIRIPKVVGISEDPENSFLVLEYIRSGKKNAAVFRKFGEYLAMIHQESNDKFGLDHNNYIGSLHQSNSFHSTWAEFFAEERLSPQLKLAFDNKRIDRSFLMLVDKLFPRLNDLFPSEAPSMLHGDLWSGNFMITDDDLPCIYDPAVYYGHREMDIAMTKLFGGFDDHFYESYHETFPLENGWIKRLELCNLYPVLVHVNLFGGSYGHQAAAILKGFI